MIVSLPRRSVGAQCWRVGENARQRWRLSRISLWGPLSPGFLASFRGRRFVVFQDVLDPRLFVGFRGQLILLPLAEISWVDVRRSRERRFGTSPLISSPVLRVDIDGRGSALLRSEVGATIGCGATACRKIGPYRIFIRVDVSLRGAVAL